MLSIVNKTGWTNDTKTDEIAFLKSRVAQLEKEKANLYARCLENKDAMYEAVIKGNDNHLIELVENGVNGI